MYGSSLTVGSWVGIRDTCPMRHRVHDGEDVEFTFGTGPKAFEFLFDRGALREFMGLATEALREMDALDAREEAEENAMLSQPDGDSG